MIRDPWPYQHSVAARRLDPCIWCHEFPGYADNGFCPACWWEYRIEVTRGFAQLDAYLAKQAAFSAYLEAHHD